MEFLQGRKRTNKCAEFSAKQVGEHVVVLGWAENVRNLGAFLFITVRDVSGKVQLLIGSENTALVKKAQVLKPESVIYAEGVVVLRQPQNVNKNMATGDIEINISALEVLSEAQPLPINSLSTEAQKLKYRYLDLRSERLQNIAITRHKITTLIRNHLDKQGFLEVETPILGKSTPEGARDYLVPSRVNEHAFYALPQSPQIYKQLLMISGFDRYFQIAKCFRDEDLRANRQPEFTQVDMEMSFVDDENQVMDMVEGLVKNLFKEIKGISFQGMFPRMTYAEAMANYGSDKPDLRFGLQLQNISEVFQNTSAELFKGKHIIAVKVEGGADKFSRKEQDKLTLLAKTHHAKGLFVFTMHEDGLKSSVLKVVAEEEVLALVSALDMRVGDIVFACADTDWETACGAMGAIRLSVGEKLNLINNSHFATLWVTQFPMFEWDNEDGRLYAKHHPFTSPMFEDLHLLNSSPTSIRSKAYDLVINGQEVGGGSVRIYNNQLQKQVFNALGFSDNEIKNKFGFFIEAFNYGVPPHAGLALGLDRLVMLFSGTENIKDVIAFPKTQSATCLMTEAPGEVSQKQLDELHIKLSNNEKE